MLLLLVLLQNAVGYSTTTLEVTQGRLQGFTREGVRIFYGIPYAKPPTGELRFRPPKPLESWRGTRQATKQTAACMQMIDTAFKRHWGVEMWNPPNEFMAEDCLHINMWIPEECTRETPCPIMEWIYGGSFTSGTANLKVYDGYFLAKQEKVILVSFNYRLGPLGFLYLGTKEVPGNMGLLDQQLAMKWIWQNAGYIGGKQDNITLFGESAGAASVSMHLFAPDSSRYFSNAIMESATAYAPWAIKSTGFALEKSRLFASLFSCNHTSLFKTRDCLRNYNARELVDKQYNILDDYFGAPLAPTIDGKFLTDFPRNLMKKKAYKRCPILLGANRGEGSFFLLYANMNDKELIAGKVSDTKYEELLRQVIMSDDPLLIDTARYVYDTSELPRPSNLDIIIRAAGDREFVCAVSEMAQAYAAADMPVYLYYFDQRSSVNPWYNWMGVIHGYEIEYVFGVPRWNSSYNVADQITSTYTVQYWTNFARTSNPNNKNFDEPQAQTWPKFDVATQKYLNISSTPTTYSGLFYKRCAFWKDLAKRLVDYNPKCVVTSSSIRHGSLLALFTLLFASSPAVIFQ